MLKKLFVHEWRDCWRMLTLLNIVVLLLTVIGVVTFRSDIWKAADKNELVAIALSSYMLFYIAAVIALGLASGVYFWFRFYRNLYTDQGYLMHTLPVDAHQLIWSKVFVAMIWQFVSSIVTIVSIVTLITSVGDFAYEDLIEVFQEIQLDGRGVICIVLVVLLMFASSLMNIFMGYASVSMGQLVKKHRLGASVGAYVILYMIIQMASSYVSLLLPTLANNIDTEAQVRTMVCTLLAVVLVVILALDAALYFITHYIMANKLNLE